MAFKLSRRTLLLAGAASAPAVSFAQNYPWRPNAADAPTPERGAEYKFFHADEAAFIEAALARLIPADEHTPGAKEAGVALFIDRQLAGGFGMGERTYLGEPFAPGTPSQGYQGHAPAVFYRENIAAANTYARANAGNEFASLAPDAQDRILKAMESGDARFEGGGNAKAFFTMLWQNTLEGYFGDPLYGGNRGMTGWRLIGFPGAHYDYRPQFAQIHQRLDLEPVGLMQVRA
ncbi:MAG: gluconate 2-dehydrogenase subunit 3 family protein [Terricaulis sp.]